MSTPADRSYTNARRAGRTHPDMIEMVDPLRQFFPNPGPKLTPIPVAPQSVPSRQYRRSVAWQTRWTESHLAARPEGWAA